jgi:hypothetical protein
MKKIIPVLAFLLAISTIGCSNKIAKHVGEWEGTDNTGETSSMILKEDGYIVLVMGNQPIGGEDFEFEVKNVE